MTEPDLLERLAAQHEVRVVTVGADGTRHRTIIWVVVAQDGRILVRSYRGASARWYREALSGRPVALEVDAATVVPVSVERATDPMRVAAGSAGFESKYADDPATPAMVAENVLDTTLELRPLSVP